MNKSRKPNAFSLTEVVLALGVLVFSGFALLGLLGVGLQNSQDSKERTQAATVAEAICSVRRAAPTNDFTVATSPQPGFPLPVLNVATNNLTTPVYLTRDGATSTVGNSYFGFLYKVTPKLDLVPTGNTTKGVSTVYMCLYWPAQASPTNLATGHFELTSTFSLK